MKKLFYIFTITLFSNFLSAATMPHEAPIIPWGIDAELTRKQIDAPNNSRSFGQKTCRVMIRFFQDYISPIDGPRSSFYPTSSQYTLDAIEKYGVFKGIALGCDRLMRENKELWVYERTDDYGITRKVDRIR